MRVLLLIVMAVLLLLVPQVRVRIQSGEALSVSVHWLFFSRRFGDEAKKPEKETKPPKEKKEKPPKEKPPAKARAGLGITLEDILDLISQCWPPLRRMLRSVKITNLKLHVRVGGADACETAIGYGKMCKYISYGQAALYNLFNTVEIDEIKVEPDFLLDSNRYRSDITIGIRPIRVLYTAVVLVIKALPAAVKLMRGTGQKQSGNATQAALQS